MSGALFPTSNASIKMTLSATMRKQPQLPKNTHTRSSTLRQCTRNIGPFANNNSIITNSLLNKQETNFKMIFLSFILSFSVLLNKTKVFKSAKVKRSPKRFPAPERTHQSQLIKSESKISRSSANRGKNPQSVSS